jgi:hypothetical protein
MVAPPLALGALNGTVACATALTAVPMVGAAGGVA